LKAVDDDDSKAKFAWSGENNDLHVTTAGVLRWVGAAPSHDDKTAANNKFKLDVTVTSSGDDVGSGDNETTREVTVTVTASDNVVVALKLNPASISEAGGTSTVTAELEDPASSEFYVTVSVTKEGSEVRLSSNKTLTIRKGDKTSSGPPVTITAINDDNAYEPGAKSDGYKRKVAVSGAMSPRIDNMEVKGASLLIEDDDLAYGKIVLNLAKGRIDETDDPDATGSQNVDTVTAVLAGGVMFPRDVTITVTVNALPGPDGELGTDDDIPLATLSSPATLTIPANTRASTGEVTITADDDDNTVNTVVTVGGTTTWNHDGDDGTTAVEAVPEASRPASRYLTVNDDDVAPGMPASVSAVSDITTGGFTISWEAPSNMGSLDGTDGAAANITYQARYTATSEANDPTTTDAEWDVPWAAQASPYTVTGATLVENRGYTVQVRTVLTVGGATLNSGSVTKTFTVPSS